MNTYCKNLLNLCRFGYRHCPQKIARVIKQINWPTSTSTEIKRYLSTSPKCLIARWVIMNDDGWQESSSPYFIVLPNVPKETAENNLFLESIEFKRDWPPMGSATPEEFYQGTVKLLMELSTTFSEQIEVLEGELNKKKLTFPFTFDTILSRPMEEYYFASYAFKTLILKMLTDWPECARMDWQKDIEALNMLANDELVERMYDTIIAEAVKKIPYDELDKLDPWTKRFVDFLKQEWVMAGLEHDTIKNKRDKKQQELNTFVLAIEIFKHCRLFYLCILFETETSKVEVKITDREQLKNAPQKVLQLLAGNNDAENGPWTAKTTDGSIFEMLKYSSAREQKQKLWEAWISKASLTTDENLVNNSPIIHVLRNLYQRYAEHLGFRSVPHLQLSTKMIGNPETLREFIASLYHRFRPVFLQRYEDWKNYADEEEGIPFGQLRPFDMFYICRREAEFYYDIDTLDLMNYFPSWKTFENLLATSRAFLGIEFKDITNENNCFMERCHHLIRIYQVTDLKTNKILGRIYVDPFSRPGKLINRWHAELWRTENYGMDKLVWLVGNMDEVKTNNKSCLHYEEIISMLKEFGRAIHLLVSESPYEWLATPFESHSHEWDAANFMPTFVGFFINKPDLLLMLSSPHMESGQSLSHQKAQDIALALARGMFWDMWRTLFWTDYDLTLYEIEKAEDKHYLDLYKEMYQEYFPFPREPNNYQPCSFTPIFAMRSRPCLYYRKLWNEALALDVHETFENEGNFSSTSARLKQIWLKNGALKSQWDMYQEFQGREPNILAMGNFYDPPSLRSLEEENRGIVAQIS